MKPLTATGQVLRTVLSYTENPTMPIQQVMILLAVVERGEMPMADLLSVVGVEQSSISRNVATLGRGLVKGGPAYGLLDCYEDPMYRKRKLVNLSTKGEAMKAALKALGGTPNEAA